MALVITLILLSVTLIMAVAFLAISRRERNAVTTTTDTATARLAADAALAHAEAQVMANIFTPTNAIVGTATNASGYNFGLLVSTNFFNPAPATTAVNATNVNYDAPGLNADQRNQALADLFFGPRAPVYLTNYVSHTIENRFYLDLNRNGVDDPNGWVTNVDNAGNFILDGSGNLTASFLVGDPEWNGQLDHPDMPHGPNNQFVSRYAFIAVPVGNTLDLNAIHNQVLDESVPGKTIPVNPPPSGGDGFFRNEGVGPWEINLAAFLADLNTNQWGSIIDAPPGPPSGFYEYSQPYGNPNVGRAFDDARALLAYRYANNYNSLASVFSLYGPNGVNAFLYDNVDDYSDGPLLTTLQPTNGLNNPNNRWAGADNTNQFFSLPSELFDLNKTAVGVAPAQIALRSDFADRMLNVGTNKFAATGGTTVPTYDRYTFYRLLSQLGSDSAPDAGKINVNYDNLDPQVTIFAGNFITNAAAATNFMAWQPVAFFTNAADRLLRIYSSNWFQGSSFRYYTDIAAVTNLIYIDPSNYLATYYGVHTNYFSYIDSQGRYIWNAPNGFGLTNLPVVGMTNQVPAFGITNIPVVINNNFIYSPAVNRLLQLAANIYDAVYYTSNYFPSLSPGLYPDAYLPNVFRPSFNVEKTAFETNVYICGFNELTERVDVFQPDAPLSVPYDIKNPVSLALLNPGIYDGNLFFSFHYQPINVFGVPMIVGAKKGFPNFNEYYMESAFRLTRKLMVTRQSTNVPSPPPIPTSSFWGYNQMYNLSLSNRFGVECWNSYRSNYTRPIDIFVTNFLVMTLTNDQNISGNYFSYSTNLVAGSFMQFGPVIPWPGYTNTAEAILSAGSFQVPLATNFAAAPDSTYRFNTPGDVEEPGHPPGPYVTTNLNLPYELNVAAAGLGKYPQLHWGLALTNNLQVVMVDHDTGRLVDYVQLSGPKSYRDLNGEIMRGYDTVGSGENTGYNDLWDTNLINGVPIGFGWQFNVSQGKGTPTWSASLWGRDQKSAYDQINAFLAFTIGPNALTLTYPGYLPDMNIIGAATMTNAMQMPYTPSATVVQDIVWQVNDPLVHYVSYDVNNPTAGDGLQIHLNWPGNLGKLNQRYQPWGGNPSTGVGTNLLAVKDPLVTCSDDWSFPTNKIPTVGWLGRVHRGTAWQTVDLKASDVLSFLNNFGPYGADGTNLWVNWTGDVNPYDAGNSAPKKDWLLFDLFSTAFNDNAARGRLSVNVAADNPDPMAGLAAWSALFSGVIVLTNNASDNLVLGSGQTAGSMRYFTNMTILPAGPAGTNSPLGQLVEGIYRTRTNFLNADGVKGVFEHAGYILSVPELTQRSPFLHWHDGGALNSVQQQKGISDAMYEWLPQQVMSLLRDSSPRYVVYCYGQALKPAPNSLVTSGTYFGMCTNYQVVAESAARAVVRVDGIGTPSPHVVVESYNPLPPD